MCLRYVLGMFEVCLKYALGMFEVCLRYVLYHCFLGRCFTVEYVVNPSMVSVWMRSQLTKAPGVVTTAAVVLCVDTKIRYAQDNFI